MSEKDREKKEIGYDDGSYVIPKKRKHNLIAFIACLLIALTIWLFVTNRDMKRQEEEQAESDEKTETAAVDGDAEEAASQASVSL